MKTLFASVCLSCVNITFTGSLIELMGVSVGNETTIAAKQNFSDLAKKLFVMPGHYVVYRIGLQSGTEEGEFHASVFVSTEFEELRVPFRFRVAKGSLSMQNQDVSFEPTFPVRYYKLHISFLYHQYDGEYGGFIVSSSVQFAFVPDQQLSWEPIVLRGDFSWSVPGLGPRPPLAST